MRPKLLKICLVFLVMAVLLVGVTGCERKAESREPEATEGADIPGGPSAGTEVPPPPGETVVSAASPAPGGGTVASVATPVTQPTAPAGEQQPTPGATAPAGGEPAATPAPETPVEPPPAPGSGTYVWHTVQPGETLYSIAKRYGSSVEAISQANGLSNPNQIYAGQKLKIPAGGSSGGTTPGCRVQHTVQRGEWVWKIARNYGVSPYDILAANGLTVQTADTILPGSVLCIP